VQLAYRHVIAETLNDVPAHCLRAGLEPAKLRRAVVGHAQRIERTGDGAAGADVAGLHGDALERPGVLAHEVFRPGDAGEIRGETAFTEANAALAVLVFVSSSSA